MKEKEGEELSLVRLKCFGDGNLVDVTIWNKELPENIEGKLICLDGVRLKLLTSQSIVFVSSVYTRINEVKDENFKLYDKDIEYTSLSKVYSERNIG